MKNQIMKQPTRPWGALRIPLALTLLLVTQSLAAQQVEQLLAAHTDAMGGEQALSQVEHILRFGEITVSSPQGDPLSGTIKAMTIPRSKTFRDTSLGMFSSTAGWDGSIGWEKGMMGLRELAGDELDRLKRETQVFFTTGLWHEPEVQVELLGDEMLNGANHHVLKYSTPDWDGITVYLNQDSMLVSRLQAEATLPGATEPSTFVTDLSNYQQVDGVMFAMQVTVSIKDLFTSDISFTQTIVNGPVYDPIFSKPDSP